MPWDVLALVAALLACARLFGAARVRSPAFAGSWYERDPRALERRVDRLLEDSPAPPGLGSVVALVAPHAGYDWSGRTAGAAYAAVRGAPVERVVVLAPSHRVPFRGVSLLDVDAYATPLGEVPLDGEACRALRKEGDFVSLAEADRGEHSLEMQLPFLQRAVPRARLVPLVVGHLDREGTARVAAALRRWLDARTLLVASSDLTHYGVPYDFDPFASDDPRPLSDRLAAFDGEAIDALLARDADRLEEYERASGINACGMVPLRILLRSVPEGFVGRLLRYETSGEISGDWTASVSYAAVAFGGDRPLLSAAEEGALLSLARAAIRARMREETPPRLAPGEGSATLHASGAAFVTLRKGEELRGCIGHVVPLGPLWRSVVGNAIAAAFEDGRFPPLATAEEPEVRLEVTVIGPGRRIAEPDAFRLGIDGVVLRRGDQNAVFLPQVARERGWDRETLLERLAEKAGLPPSAWREASLEVFSAHAFREAGPGG